MCIRISMCNVVEDCLKAIQARRHFGHTEGVVSRPCVGDHKYAMLLGKPLRLGTDSNCNINPSKVD